VYNVAAQLWLWFKTDPQAVEAGIRRANGRAQGPCYVFKEGFVDYWKCSPLRRLQERPPLNANPAGQAGS